MNQEYRGRVDRFLKSGGDPKYVNVKRKAEARHGYSPAKKALDKMSYGDKTAKAAFDKLSPERKANHKSINRHFKKSFLSNYK